MKFKIIYEYTYDVDMNTAKDIYGTDDVNEMLEIDVENYNSDPYLLIDSDGQLTIRGEIVD